MSSIFVKFVHISQMYLYYIQHTFVEVLNKTQNLITHKKNRKIIQNNERHYLHGLKSYNPNKYKQSNINEAKPQSSIMYLFL